MMNSHNQYICDFCKTPCLIRGKSDWIDKKSRWHICPKCSVIKGTQVMYAVKQDGYASALLFIVPHEENCYQTIVHFKNSTTEVNYLKKYYFMKNNKEKSAYESKMLLSFPFCMNTFTPSNIKDKIKLMLLFQ